MSENEQNKKAVTLIDILEECSRDVCEKICKWKDEYSIDEYENLIIDHCNDCPLNYFGSIGED